MHESEASADVRQSLRQSTANFTATMTNENNRPTTAVLEATAHDHGDATLAHATEDARPGESVVLFE